MPDVRVFCTLLTLLAVAGSAGAQQRRAPQPPRVVSEVVIQRQLIIRVPRLPAGRSPAASTPVPPPIRWKEKKTDKCVPLLDLAAASIMGADSVDLILNGGRRLRAKLDDDCRALDFYSGFYVSMTADGKVCANRDSIRARSGGECRIRSFRALIPAR